MSHLILVRHGTSEWNKQGRWTGWTDVDLAEEGVEEARGVAELLHDIPLHTAHVSALKRAQQTLHHIAETLSTTIPTAIHEALNERHYGIHTGKNKWEVKEQIGDEAFHKLRRAWDHPVTDGESLKQVSDRVIPYFESVIKPDLLAGKNVIVTAHGNSLRALVKHIEGIPDERIADVEVDHGEAHCYRFNEDTSTFEKEVRKIPK